MRNRRSLEGKPGLELVEEAVQLLRVAPAAAMLSYYAGALPFTLGLLYFWSDMSQSAFASARLPGAALGLAILFVWMKTWQARFAASMRAHLGNEPPPRWPIRRWLHVALIQGILQPAGLFLLIPALLVLLPFGWVYAFFQNMSVLGGDGDDIRTVLRRTARQTMLWPRQNHTGLLVLKLFGLFILINLIAAVLAAPYLLKTLLGIENTFTRLMQDPFSVISVVFNTTFLAAIAALTYLCLDPLLKTFYVLRCFYGESLHTGQDLKTDLRPFLNPAVTAALAMVFFLTCAAPRMAAAPVDQRAGGEAAGEKVTAPRLNKSIEEVLNRREYSWRLPRQEEPDSAPGAITAFFQGIAESIKSAVKTVGGWAQKFIDWLGNFRKPSTAQPGAGGGWMSALHNLIFVLSVVLACFIMVLLLRLWHRRRRLPTDEVSAQPVVPIPDLADENVGADQLPEDGWLTLARELIDQGEFRLALRAFYLASLAQLAARNLITIAKFKSNRDYQRELERRGHAMPDLFSLFRHNVSDFDRVWYGLHEVNRELLDRFAHNVDRIRAGVVSHQ